MACTCFSFSIDSYSETHIKLVTDGANTADVVSDPQPTRSNTEVMASNTIVIRLRQGQSVWLDEYLNSDGTLAKLINKVITRVLQYWLSLRDVKLTWISCLRVIHMCEEIKLTIKRPQLRRSF